MGKTMKLTVSIPVASDTSKVEFPMLQNALAARQKYIPLLNDSVELLTEHTVARENQNNKAYVKYSVAVQSFDSGRYELPPLEFIVDGKKVTSNKVAFDVLPVKVKADDKIDPANGDIKEPFELNPNPEEMEEPAGFLWWLIPVALIVLAIIAYLYMRYRKTGSLLMLSKPLPPYAVALNKLRKLQGQNLPQKGKTKEYYTKLTDILRGYINRQFRIKTFEKTTSEILKEISEDERLSGYTDVLKSIFETADFVKFAKVQPSVIENSRCLTDAERFVEQSHPAPEETKKEEQKKKGGEK